MKPVASAAVLPVVPLHECFLAMKAALRLRWTCGKMERNKRDKNFISDTAELFDLPIDLLSGLPHIEMMGNRQFYMENHRGILSYSEDEIAVSAEGLIVRVFGKKLELVSMSGDALRIRGTIERVEWVR